MDDLEITLDQKLSMCTKNHSPTTTSNESQVNAKPIRDDSQLSVNMQQLIEQGCNLNSDEIQCLTAERPLSSDSGESLTSYSLTSKPEEVMTKKLDESVMKSWLSQGSLDSEWSLNQEEENLTSNSVENQSDMEEFNEFPNIKNWEKIKNEKNDFICTLQDKDTNNYNFDVSNKLENYRNKRDKTDSINFVYLKKTFDELCDIPKNDLNKLYTSPVRKANPKSKSYLKYNPKMNDEFLKTLSHGKNEAEFDQIKTPTSLDNEANMCTILNDVTSESYNVGYDTVKINGQDNVKIEGSKNQTESLIDSKLDFYENKLQFPLLSSTLKETQEILNKMEKSFKTYRKIKEENCLNVTSCINCADAEIGLTKKTVLTENNQSANENEENSFTCKNVKRVFVPNRTTSDSEMVGRALEKETKVINPVECINVCTMPSKFSKESISGDIGVENIVGDGLDAKGHKNCLNFAGTCQSLINSPEREGDVKNSETFNHIIKKQIKPVPDIVTSIEANFLTKESITTFNPHTPPDVLEKDNNKNLATTDFTTNTSELTDESYANISRNIKEDSLSAENNTKIFDPSDDQENQNLLENSEEILLKEIYQNTSAEEITEENIRNKVASKEELSISVHSEVKSILKKQSNGIKQSNSEKEKEKHVSLMEPVHSIKEHDIHKPNEIQSDVATALRFMTEAYPKYEEEDPFSDSLTASQDLVFSKPPGENNQTEIFEDLPHQSEECLATKGSLSQLKSPKKLNTLEPLKKSKSKSGNKFSKFFKSFGRKVKKE